MADPELSSALPYEKILAVFQDYSDYDLVPNAARARIHIKAGRMLLAIALRRSSRAERGEEVEVEPEIVERSVRSAIAWLSAYTAATTPPPQYIPTNWRDED